MVVSLYSVFYFTNLLFHCFSVPEGVIDVGTVVWALWTGIRYYKGFVSYKGSKLHVDFYDGDKYLFDLKDAMVTVLPDIVPKTCDIQVDTMVIARFKQRPYYFSGIVKEIDNSDPKLPRFLVQFDDGDKEVNTIDTIRVLHVKKDAGESAMMMIIILIIVVIIAIIIIIR